MKRLDGSAHAGPADALARLLAPGRGPQPPAGAGRAFAHEHVAAQARRTPAAHAVIDGGAILTYGELERRANRIAHLLQRRGAGPERVVALFLHRSADLVAAMLAVLKAGAAFLPLDPAYPPRWLRYVLDDSAAPLVVTRDDLRGRLPRSAARVVCLDRETAVLDDTDDRAPACGVRAGNPAYVFYTSGSSGRPKGVVWPHARVVERDPAMQAFYEFSVHDRHLFKSAAGFTLLVREVMWPLRSGAALFVMPADEPQDPGKLASWIADRRISIVSLVPSMLVRLLDEPAFLDAGALRHVVCFGEPLGAELRRRFLRAHHARLSVFYGATEAPSAAFIEHRAADERPGVPVGRPLPGRDIYVLDAGMRPLAPGIEGEIHVGGNIARCYLGRPALTAERFVPHPFAAQAGARLYRTGDRGRWTADGVLEYLGRADDQTNVRGTRVELAEVEAVLAEHPGVGEAAAAVHPGAAGEPVLVGYVVARPGQAATDEALRAHLRERLPAHMVPAVLVAVAALPRTPAGKLDRRALAAPAGAAQPAAPAAPRSDMERLLVQLWCTLLERSQVAREDDFFALGASSVTAARLVARLRAALGIDVALRAVFDAPRLADLAHALEAAVRREGGPARPRSTGDGG